MNCRLMNAILLCACLTPGRAVLAAWQGAAGSQDSVMVPLRSRQLVLGRQSSDSFQVALRTATGVALHGLVLLRRYPRLEDWDRLAAQGLRLLHPVLGRVYMASVAKTLDRTQPDIARLLVSLALLAPSDKVDPDLWQGRYARFAVTRRGVVSNYAVNTDSSLRLLVSFQEDTPQPMIADALARYARTSTRIDDRTSRVVATRANLLNLALLDIVCFIAAGPPLVLSENDKTRAAINVDQVQQWDVTAGKALGLGGAGVQVGVFDDGFDEDHDDFRVITGGALGGSRVIVTDPARNWHATLVAGIIAGNGWRSDKKDSWGVDNGGTPYQWRGMAPEAQLIEHVVPDADGTLNLDPVRILNYIQKQGMDISNHSYSFESGGSYGTYSILLDRLVRGDEFVGGVPIPPRLAVLSAGNAGDQGYFSLTKEVKNGLLVGDWYLDANRVDRYSSLGPTWDGRIKPDVVAPGTYVQTTGFWDPALPLWEQPCKPTPTGGQRRNFYAIDCGTSLSAPAVTGLLALVLQQYAISYAVNIDQHPPLPSTLRGLAIHSAHDVAGPVWFATDPKVQAFPGPDFATGFGMVDANGAVDLVKQRLIIEDKMDNTCDVKGYSFTVPTPSGGMQPDSVKVTLAWDDPAPGNPITNLTASRLINDLDLSLIDPHGVRHYPWQLDQEILDASLNPLPNDAQPCGTDVLIRHRLTPFATVQVTDIAPAGFGPDHLNNVEQVVAEGIPGVWKVEVGGFRIGEGPQRFSLIGLRQPFVVVNPRYICEVAPILCQKQLEGICHLYPPLCEGVRRLPFRGDTVTLSFGDVHDRVILPLVDACRQLGIRDGCQDPAGTYVLGFGPSPGALALQVFSSSGSLVAGDSTLRHTGRVQVRPRNGETYFLIVTPSRDLVPGVSFDVPFGILRRMQ